MFNYISSMSFELFLSLKIMECYCNNDNEYFFETLFITNDKDFEEFMHLIRNKLPKQLVKNYDIRINKIALRSGLYQVIFSKVKKIHRV